jgi:hypothetical protein
LVEQWIENPRVSSSNLDPGTIRLLSELYINIFRRSYSRLEKTNMLRHLKLKV